MDKFLEKHNLPKLTEDEIDDLSRPISIKEVEQKVNNLIKQKVPDPTGFIGEFTFEEEIISLFTISFR